MDRDRNITHDTDINIKKEKGRKKIKKIENIEKHANQCKCSTLFMRHIYRK